MDINHCITLSLFETLYRGMLLRSKDLSHCPMEYYSIVWDVSITTVYGGMLFRIMMHIP